MAKGGGVSVSTVIAWISTIVSIAASSLIVIGFIKPGWLGLETEDSENRTNQVGQSFPNLPGPVMTGKLTGGKKKIGRSL